MERSLSFGLLIMIAHAAPVFAGAKQSQMTQSVPMSPGQYASINTVPQDYETTEFFHRDSLHDAFLEIVKRNIGDGDKIKLLERVYAKAKHLIEKPDDFITLLKAVAKMASPNEIKLCVARFIRSDFALAAFYCLNPSIDDVMKLQAYIFEIQVDTEPTVATLILLKNMFIRDFKDANLIRLLAYGCEKPCAQYQEQLEALKKLRGIPF